MNRRALGYAVAVLVVVAATAVLIQQTDSNNTANRPQPVAFDFEFTRLDPPVPPVVEAAPFGKRLPPERGGRHAEIADWFAKIKPLVPLNEIPAQSSQTARSTSYGESEILLSETWTHDAQQNLESISLLMDCPDVWPGALLQGKTIRGGQPAAISVDSRTPISVTLLGLTTASGDTNPPQLSYVMQHPGIATYQQALQHLQATANGLVSPPRFQFTSEQAYSRSHALFQLHADAHYFSAAFSADVRTVTDSDKARVFVSLRQDFYSIAVDAPKSSTSFLGDSVTRESLLAYVSGENPPTYVKSVTYGRVILAEVLDCNSSSSLRAALNASYDAGVGGFNLDLSTEHLQAVSSATFGIYVRGGPANESNKVLTLSGSEALKKLNSLLSENPMTGVGSMGVPVAFSVCNLADNTAVALHSVTRYSMRKSLSAAYRFSVCLKSAVINDDHDGWFRGDGDFVVWARQSGQEIDLERWARSMPTGNHAIDSWSPVATSASRHLELTIQVGEQDEDPDVAWERASHLNGSAKNTQQVDLASPTTQFKILSPGNNGGNRWNFEVKLCEPLYPGSL